MKHVPILKETWPHHQQESSSMFSWFEKRWPHCSMIRAHLSNLKFRNDICVHHFKSEVASLLASKHLKLKLGITCQIFATFETTNASETSSAYKLFCIEAVPQTVAPDLESGNGELFLRPQLLKWVERDKHITGTTNRETTTSVHSYLEYFPLNYCFSE